jgi:1-deoxy-D-xylulose-5-phosphate synthase
VTGLLDGIDSPQDLRGLSDADLAQVAQEIRELLIDTVGEVGGHFGANLGTCEIAVALHSLLDSPRDKVLWDVGHQAYPHKVLTGRREQLRTIRQYGGLAPFCSIFESEHDAMGAGHASTSIGYAVGMKEAMRRGDAPGGRVVAVIGDGAMTGGAAFEAIQQAGGLGTPIVVVLNDNGMSIAPNVGALSGYLHRVRSEETPGLWWEELGWAYLGIVDGHDLRALRRALRAAFRAERPIVVHCATVKGKGFAPAELGGLAGMEKWHAAKPRSIAGRRPARSAPGADDTPAPPPPYTEVFGNALLAECRRDRRVVGITAAMASGTGLAMLQRAMPERCFDVGIAEQQAVLFAAGLARCGSRPVVAVYSTFLQRAYDQIVHDLCLQSLPVVLCLDRAGLVGDDGPTHHGAFDIGYLRGLPNITLMAPRDEAMLVHMLHTALRHEAGPVAIRYPRGQAVGVPLPATPEPIAIGTGDIVREGERVAILGYGSGVHQALRAADILAERGLHVTVADARFAKPIDAGLLAQLAAEHELLVSVEEGVLMGGFGSAVLECLSEGGLTPRMLRIGLPDRYVTHGKPVLLHEEIGFTPEQIAERVEAAVLDPRRPLAQRPPS